MEYFLGLLFSFLSIFGANEPTVGATYIRSLQLAASPSNGLCLKTDGSDNLWGSCAGGAGSGNTTWELYGGILQPTTTKAIAVNSTATSSFSGPLKVATTTSGWPLLIVGSSTDVTDFLPGVAIMAVATTTNALTTLTQNNSQDTCATSAFTAGTYTTSFTKNFGVFLHTGQNWTGANCPTFGGDVSVTPYDSSLLYDPNGYVQFGSGTTTADAGFEWFTASSAGRGSNIKMVLDSNGYLGVGTTTPGSFLSVHARNGQTTTTLFNVASSTASATTTLFRIDNTGVITTNSVTSALVSASSGGVLSGYAGASCTNQAITALSAAGASTCSSITDTFLSGAITVAHGGTGQTTFTSSQLLYGNGTNALSSVATSSLAVGTGLTSSGTLGAQVGGTASTISFATIAANSLWVNNTGATAVPTAISTSTLFAIINASTLFQMPSGASQSPTLAGALAHDTTSDQIKFGNGSVTKVLGNGNDYTSFTYATSTAWTATTTVPLGPSYVAETWNGIQCFTDAGTVNVSLYDGTNRMNLLNASTTVGTVVLSTNNTFTAAEKRYADIGTPASSPTKISCTVSRSLTAD